MTVFCSGSGDAAEFRVPMSCDLLLSRLWAVSAVAVATIAFASPDVSVPVDTAVHSVPNIRPIQSAPNADAERNRLADEHIRWIVGKTGWKTAARPRIETRSDSELVTMFFGAATGIDGAGPLALYAREQHVLFLSDRLVFDKLIDESILLHELVHHLQIVNGIRFECREDAEAQAYRLQIRWLTERGVQDPYRLLGFSEAEISALACP